MNGEPSPTTKWFTDPCKTADECITNGGLVELRKRFFNEVVNTATGDGTAFAVGGDDSKCGMLIRGRGMVQDISTMQRLSVIREFPKSGKILFSDYPEDEVSTSEEMVSVTFAYLSLIPGENYEYIDFVQSRRSTKAAKRRLSDPNNEHSTTSQGDTEMTDNSEEVVEPLSSNNYATVDTVRNVTTMEGTSQHSGFIVRLYDCDVVALNEIMEFWGVIHPDEDPEGDVFSYIPQSLIKTVHNFSFSKPRAVTIPRRIDIDMRAHLLSYLIELFGGDTFIGEMMLLHLIGSVVEHEPVPIGTIPLNLTNCTVEHAKLIVGGIRMVCSLFVAHKLVIPELNKLDWIPEMDYEKEYLRTGRLQLANSTYLVMDETSLQQGTLQHTGIKALRALTTIANEQRIEYPCAYSTLDLKTNYPMLVLSTGSSLLRLSTVIPLQSGGCPTASRRDLAERYDLPAIRDFIIDCKSAPRNQTKMEEFEDAICSSIASVKGEFPNHYRETPAINESPVHCWMTLARLLAISKGESIVTIKHWEYAVSLGREILRRAASK